MGRGQTDADDEHFFGGKIRGVEFGDANIRRLRMRRPKPHSRERWRSAVEDEEAEATLKRIGGRHVRRWCVRDVHNALA